MVSFWPFKGDDSSPESFEKALAALSGKISKHEAHLSALHQSARRLKALWTLYTSFAYLIYTIIVSLVLGWSQWGLREYGLLAGGPTIILGGRYIVAAYYNLRINSVQSKLEVAQKERENTIDKLKAATKYNSTQQLLEKYGGGSPKATEGTPKRNQKANEKSPSTPKGAPSNVQRTGFVPPPTANIQRDVSQPPHSTPQTPKFPIQEGSRSTQASSITTDPPGFAPNAFQPSAQPSMASYQTEPQWYDRLIDLLMGEDEALAKNRIVLICQNCKLVNGQAPPGVKTLGDLGRWKCGGCGKWNGEESETARIVATIKETANGNSSKDRSQITSNDAPSNTDDVAQEVSEADESDGGQEGKTRKLPPRKGRAIRTTES